MDNGIVLAPEEALRTREYIFNLSASLTRIAVSQRLFAEYGTETLYQWLAFGGTLITGEDKKIAIYPGIFDDLHSENSQGEWVSAIRRISELPQRRPKKTLLGRLRIYDAIARIQGKPIGNEPRQKHVAEVRGLIRQFTPVWRARYVNETRKLRRQYRGERAVHYGAAVHRLRIRFAEELAAWQTTG